MLSSLVLRVLRIRKHVTFTHVPWCFAWGISFYLLVFVLWLLQNKSRRAMGRRGGHGRRNLTTFPALALQNPSEAEEQLKARARATGQKYIELPAKAAFTIKPEKHKVRTRLQKRMVGPQQLLLIPPCLGILSWGVSSSDFAIASPLHFWDSGYAMANHKVAESHMHTIAITNEIIQGNLRHEAIKVRLWPFAAAMFAKFFVFPSFTVKNGQNEMLQICCVSVRSQSIEMTQNWLETAVPSPFFQKKWLGLQSQAFFLVHLGFHVKIVGLFGPKTALNRRNVKHVKLYLSKNKAKNCGGKWPHRPNGIAQHELSEIQHVMQWFLAEMEFRKVTFQ